MNFGFERREKAGFVYYCAPMLEMHGAVNMFTTRLGGVSGGAYASLNFRRAEDEKPENIIKNYRIAMNVLGRDAESLVCTHQVHGCNVAEVRSEDAGRGFCREFIDDADGIITCEKSITLAGFYADCLPIILFDAYKKAVGVVHCGWRGTALNICRIAVEKMRSKYGSKPENIMAALGPAICAGCFETNAEVPEAMIDAFGNTAKRHIRKKGSKYMVDIAGINLISLKNSGIKDENITVSGLCTKCSGDEFWSHRATAGVRGVHAAFVGITK